MTFAREEFRAGAYALFPAIIGGIPYGLVAGVAGAVSGLTPLETMASSVFIFSGIGQLIVYQLIGSGSPTTVILLASVIVSLRLVMYSAVLAPHFEALNMRWKFLLAYLTTDHGFAASVLRFQKTEDPHRRAWFHLGGGVAQWLSWQPFVAIGSLLGAQLPTSWSLDFVVPLSFLAMLIPAIKDRGTAVAATVGGVVALAAAGLPFRLSLIAGAIAGITAGFLSDWRRK
jgi:predicted branched-subunit amino acid permease